LVAIALFLLWIVFNGKLTWELAAFGAVISITLAWFVHRFIAPEFTLKKQLAAAKRTPDYLRYAWLLIKEIIKANFAVMRLILSDRDVVAPKLAFFKTQLKTTAARVALADSITLTPGTITVHLQEDEYLVHCLDESMEAGLQGSDFEKQLKNIEVDWEEEMRS
jgi:multicomponent Na+:H+ antiporter subunit E